MLNRKEKGFTLLELLISVFILSVGILGAYVAIQKSATIASYSYDRLMAAYLAQEGIEIIRNIKDTNLLEGLTDSLISWKEGVISGDFEVQYSDVQDAQPMLLTYSDRPLLKGDFFYNYNSGEETKFKRKITIEVNTEIVLIVSATVSWQDGTKTREFTVWDEFYNWF